MPHKYLLKKYFIPSILFLIGIAIGFFVFFYITSTFRIHHIEITGSTKEEQSTIATLTQGLSTLTVNQTDIKKLITMRFPTMKIRESHFLFPSTLFVVVEKEKPLAYLITDHGYLALSKNGTIVMKERSTTIPNPSISFYQIIHHSEYQTGQDIGYEVIKRALTFITLLEEEGYQTETVAIDSVDMIACKTKGFEIAFSQSRPVELQSHEAQQVIRQIKAGALRIMRLDLRFDKPVVQLQQK